MSKNSTLPQDFGRSIAKKEVYKFSFIALQEPSLPPDHTGGDQSVPKDPI